MCLEPRTGGRLRRVLRNRDLTLLLGAGLVSQTGDWILATGVSFEAYVLSGSTLLSAAILVASQLPQALLGSPAGVLVDRGDRRRTMLAGNAVLGLALLPLLAVQRADQLWIVVAVVAVSGCVVPFFAAAEASLVPEVVPPDLLVTANAMNGQARNLARLVGAACGGALVAVGGFAAIALADLSTFGLAVVLIALVRHRRDARGSIAPHPMREWAEGLRAVRASTTLTVLLVFFALAGIGEAVMGTLFAPFVREELGGSAAAFGGILSAQAAGGIAGGLVVTLVGHRCSPRSLFGVGALAFGVLDGVLFLSPLVVPGIWPAVADIAVVGLPSAALAAGVATLFSTATPDRLRGRVFGVLTAAQNTTMLLGSAIAGAAAEWLGVLPVILVQAVVYVLGGVLALGVLRPASVRVAVPA